MISLPFSEVDWPVQVQSNPGPGCSYPCTVCQRNVRNKDAAVSCDLCNGWSHTVCVGISDEEYGNLMDQNSFNFFCHKCTLAELQGRSKRSGWSGHGRTNNRAGKFYFIFLMFLNFLLYFLAGIIIEPGLFSILFLKQRRHTLCTMTIRF